MSDLALYLVPIVAVLLLTVALWPPRRPGTAARRASAFCLGAALVCLSLGTSRIALAQGTAGASTLNVTALAVLLPGVIALSTQCATALRDALTAHVPPAGFVLPAKYAKWRPWLAALVGALVAFLGSLMAAEASGGVAMSKAMLITAGGAALANLAITIPKLIYSEASSGEKSTGSPYRDKPTTSASP